MPGEVPPWDLTQEGTTIVQFLGFYGNLQFQFFKFFNFLIPLMVMIISISFKFW